jgi:exonuclease VII large subunit
MDPENRDGERDQEKLLQALNTIADVVVRGELRGVREMVAGVEKELTERIEALNRQTIDAVDRAREDMETQLGLLRNSLSDEENARKTAGGEFERQVEQTRSALEENLATRETSVRNELSELREEQSRLRQGFQEQDEQAQRLSGVLDNLAGVFSRQRGERTPETVEATPRTEVERPTVEARPNRDGEMIEELVNQAFDGSHSWSNDPPRD